MNCNSFLLRISLAMITRAFSILCPFSIFILLAVIYGGQRREDGTGEGRERMVKEHQEFCSSALATNIWTLEVRQSRGQSVTLTPQQRRDFTDQLTLVVTKMHTVVLVLCQSQLVWSNL